MGSIYIINRNDQRYFYDWECFHSVDELNKKLKVHLKWSNNKTMRVLERESPLQLCKEKLKRA